MIAKKIKGTSGKRESMNCHSVMNPQLSGTDCSGTGALTCARIAMQLFESRAESAPPPSVEVVNVAQKDVPIYREWIGSTDGIVNATIRRRSGYLVSQKYKEGEHVRKGQVLFEIGSRTFIAALEPGKRRAGSQPEPTWRV